MQILGGIIALMSFASLAHAMMATATVGTIAVGENTYEIQKFTDPSNGVECYFAEGISALSCLKP